jgi:hypothetical protein
MDALKQDLRFGLRLLARTPGVLVTAVLALGIGASRGRLARQLLTESLILAIAGGALGLLLAWGGVRAFVAAAPPVLPRMASIAPDGYMVAFTFAIAVCTGIVFGLAPVLHARDGGFGDALKEETGRATGGRRSRRAADTLVVVEVALSLVLLVAAGLMVKSLLRLEQQDIGVAVERELAFDVSLPHSR